MKKHVKPFTVIIFLLFAEITNAQLKTVQNPAEGEENLNVLTQRYFIRDGIKAIDHLLTLKYVDPERIGVTCFSGGGTISSYLAAFDDRIKVSVPFSWATASRRLLETKGAQDAETEFISSVAEGITLEDLLEVRAPKPTLLTFVSRDEYLSLQGAREAYGEVLKAYEVLGGKDNLELFEDDSKPGGRIEQYVKNGHVVAVADPLGTGETKNTATHDLAPGYTA